MRVRFVRPSYFVWVALPTALYLGYLAYGLPHVIFSYDWRDNGTYDPRASRHYTRCSFIGPYGEFTTIPRNGACGWVLFRQKGERG